MCLIYLIIICRLTIGEDQEKEFKVQVFLVNFNMTILSFESVLITLAAFTLKDQFLKFDFHKYLGIH